MWEVITERDGIEVSYRWFPTKKKAEAFAVNKLANGMKVNTKDIEENGKAVTEMMNLLMAKVIQQIKLIENLQYHSLINFSI